jgi:hypothetical protein
LFGAGETDRHSYWSISARREAVEAVKMGVACHDFVEGDAVAAGVRNDPSGSGPVPGVERD